MSDPAIADIWGVLEDDEKTLDILAKYSNLSINLRPKFMETLSTVDQITHGLHYMVEALSYVHARVCFINMENEQYHVAETYIMQFENMSWWKKVMEQNKKFGGQGNFKFKKLRFFRNLRFLRNLRFKKNEFFL